MEELDYGALYALQDRVLDSMKACDTAFYLTGGTCINRFMSPKRYSDDLDFFSSENALFRDDCHRSSRRWGRFPGDCSYGD
jgi:predicted nucleotidyltransferase component of viral defense system